MDAVTGAFSYTGSAIARELLARDDLARAVFFGACSFTSVESILRHRLDKQPLPTTAEAPTTVLAHQNIRGAGYFDTIQ